MRCSSITVDAKTCKARQRQGEAQDRAAQPNPTPTALTRTSAPLQALAPGWVQEPPQAPSWGSHSAGPRREEAVLLSMRPLLSRPDASTLARRGLTDAMAALLATVPAARKRVSAREPGAGSSVLG